MEAAVSRTGNTTDISHFTLSEVMKQVGGVINREFPHRYWFTCDIDDIKKSAIGHVYMTLGHQNKGEQKSSVKAVIWKNDTGLVKMFESQTGIRFTKNITVLFLGQVTFNTQYGLSIKILDVNPSFSIGQHELKLRKIREELHLRGYSQLNRSLSQPNDFSRVAVIAPTNAAGLHDFKTQADLLERYHLCQFDYYDAIFQGERRIETFSAAFKDLVLNEKDYDCVCIIRGGGDATGLSELAEWKLALIVCRCPYPVFTGIGHETDEILLDEYANISFATPSMVATHLYNTIVNNAHQAFNNLSYITKAVKLVIDTQKQDCETFNNSVFTRMWVATNSWRMEVNRQSDKIFNLSNQSISNSRFEVTNNFNRLIKASTEEVNNQKQNALKLYQSIKLDAFKTIQKANNEVRSLKSELDSQSRYCIDDAKQDIVRSFNHIQLSSARVISEQKNQLNQLWLELYSESKAQVNMAKDYVSYKLITVISDAKRQVSISKAETNVSWGNIQTASSNNIERAKDKVIANYNVIDAYNPQKTLERGYSIIYSHDGEVIRDTAAITSGQIIKVRMKDGTFDAKVDKEDKI